MSLQLILGSSGVGKSYYSFTKIIEESRKNPEKNYLVIVPEQFTMQTQKELVSLHPDQGIMNIDVLSFQRLAYRVFEEVGGGTNPVLEETGKTLVLQRVAQEQQKKLKVLGTNLKRTGAVAQMKSLVSELMQYQVNPESLEQWAREAEGKQMLSCKLQDISTIYDGFLKFMEGRYIAGEEVLDVLCQRIGQSELVKGSTVLLDGFTGFTPIQNQVVGELLRLSERVYVTAAIDEKEDPFHYDGPHRLFSMTKKMIGKLVQTCQESKVDIEDPVRLKFHKNSRFAHAPALGALEANLFRYRNYSYPSQQEEIVIRAAEDPQSELEAVAITIHRLVREQGYRYKDFAVVTGDLTTYGHYAEQVFGKLQIPCFVDEKHSVLMNPLVEFMRSAVDLAVQNFSYESVFRYLRCGMSSLTMEEVDELENYCIALGIRGKKKYEEKWVRVYRGMNKAKLEEINTLRERFLDEVSEFIQGFKEKNLTVEKRTRVLYQFICANNIQEKLKIRELEFKAAGNTAMEREYGQIYGIIMNLLDKLVEVLGTETIRIAHYQEILEAGFLEVQVGLIPPAADQVMIGDIERTRLKDVKILFFVGINEGVIPKPVSRAGILSEPDREYLQKQEIELAPTAREEMYMQRFYLYLNLTKPSEKLYLSYCKSNSKGEAMLPSYLIGMIRKLYPEIQTEDLKACDLLWRLETPDSALNPLAEGLRQWKEGERDPVWEELYSWYYSDKNWKKAVEELVTAAFYENPGEAISKAVAKAMYGNVLVNSATRLEQFAACAFAHFVKYGLELEERPTYEFNDADMGSIMHTALEHFSQKLSVNGLHWRDLTEELREKLIDESVEELVHDYGNTILHSSSRNLYMITRVKRMLRRTVWALQTQVEKGRFEPGGFEVSFAMEDNLDAINFELAPDEKVKLRGRIDRMDVCETEDKVYVKIIDYKSGNTSLNLVELYYGLQIQLVVYMNAAVELEQKKHPGKQVEPAGIFYYQIKDPLVSAEGDESQEEVLQKVLQALKLDGLSRAEDEVIFLMDTTLGAGSTSAVIPVGYNKNGSLSRYSHVAEKKDFETISRFTNRKIQEIGRQILDGAVQVSPYRMEKKEACTYCPYGGICGFDERIDGFSYRDLKKEKQEEILAKMREEI